MQRHLDSLPMAATIALFSSVVVMIAVEMTLDLVRRRRIDVRDSANSMSIGLGYLGVKIILGKALAFASFLYLYGHYRLFWIAAWLVGDFVYYWIHRAEHRVRLCLARPS